MFAGWSRLLPDGIDLWPVRLPGRQDRLREPPFTSMGPLVQALSYELAPAFVSPFVLMGHSMGALVAFELARELRRRGQRSPVALLLASCAAPDLSMGAPLLHKLPDERFVAELRRLGGIPEAVARSDELLELVLPALRADIALCETYEYAAEPPLEVPISTFVGSRDLRVSRAEMAAWRHHTDSDFVSRVLPGDHFFSRPAQSTLVNALAEDLRARLDLLRAGA
jgi:medium-chain acyl-[acyl-carrier-protein] hydrolase